jgi:hypothetical protein
MSNKEDQKTDPEEVFSEIETLFRPIFEAKAKQLRKQFEQPEQTEVTSEDQDLE